MKGRKMTVQAQNALLKDIGRAAGIYGNPYFNNECGILLPTILSRCVVLEYEAGQR